MGLAGKAGVSQHDHAPAPNGRRKGRQKLAQLDVLWAFALRVEDHGPDRHAEPAPGRHDQPQRVSESEPLKLVQARVVGQRLFLAGAAHERGVGNQIERAIRRWRQQSQHRAGQRLNQLGGTPVAGAPHAQHGPVV